MDENVVPEDPIGPPMLGPALSDVTARTLAPAGSRRRKDGLDGLTTWPTISVLPGS